MHFIRRYRLTDLDLFQARSATESHIFKIKISQKFQQKSSTYRTQQYYTTNTTVTQN